MILPPSYVSNIKEEKIDEEKVSAQYKLFTHTVLYRNHRHYHKRNMLNFSSYLDADVSEDQLDLLNPTPLDMMSGFLMKDDQWEGAQK